MKDPKIFSFVEETRELVIKTLLEASGGGELVRKTVPFKVGHADVAIIRGGAIEKASVTHMVLNQVQPPELDQVMDYMVFQVEIFPENPLVPMGHFNSEWGMTGQGPYHMMLDVFPAVPEEQTYASARTAMDGVAAVFDMDKEDFRDAKVPRIQIVRAEQDTTMESLAEQSPLTNYALDQLRVINGLYPNGQPEEGQLIKIID
jgi:hypothetical protein